MSLVWTDPCQALATVCSVRRRKRASSPVTTPEPSMQPLDGSLVRDPHAVVPDVVVGEDRPQHVGPRRREQRPRPVGDVEMLEPPGACGVRAMDVEHFELDRHAVELKPDLRHLRERADLLTERLGCGEPLRADHVEVEARRPVSDTLEEHVERLANLEPDVVHELLVGHRDDVVVDIGTIGEELAEQRSRREPAEERSAAASAATRS